MPQNVGGQSFNPRYDLIVQDEEKMAKPEFKFPIVTASSHYSKFSQNHHHLPSRLSTSILQEVPTSTTKLNPQSQRQPQLQPQLQPPPPTNPTYRHLSLSHLKRLTLQPLNRPSRSIRSHFRNLSLSTPIITLPDHSTTSTTLAQSSLAPLRFHRHHPHPSDTASVSCITKIDTAPNSQIHHLPSPQPDPSHYQRLKTPRIRSLSTLPNSNSTSMDSERPYPPTRHHHHHHHSFSEVSLNQNDPYESGNVNSSESSSDSHKDLVSRQLWEELEQELGEKIEFPLDVNPSSQSSSPIPQQFDSMSTTSFPSFKAKPHSTYSTLSNELQPSSSKRNINLSPILQVNTPRGIASELRESMATPKPRRPSVPAPRELISQISTGIPPIHPDPLNNPVDTARTALHKLPSNLQSNESRRDSTASSEISLSAIFGNDTDSLEDSHDLEGFHQSQDARLSATLSTSSQLSMNLSNPSSSLTRPRYLSGESTGSELEVATPNDTMMHSLASSVKTSSIEPLNASLDALHLHQTDEMNEARELIDDSWVASSLPSTKPLIPLGSQHTRRQAKPSQSPLLVSGEIPISFTPNLNLSSHPTHKPRHSRRGSQRFRHAPHPSTSSSGSIADSQRACSYTSSITNATSNIEAYHPAFEPISSSRSKEANESRVLKAQSAPPGIHGKIQHSRVSSVISQASVPSTNNPPIPEKVITRRKRSASASVPRQRYSPPTSSLPEIPKDHPALKPRPSLDFRTHSTLLEFPKPPIRPCPPPPPPLPSLPLPPLPSMKLVPITRTLRRQRSQPTLEFSISKPIVPSPLNLSNIPSPPPSPDRFKKEEKGGVSSSGMNRLRCLSTSRSRLPFHHSRNKSEVNMIGYDLANSNQNVVRSTFED
ncbi:uncharacterized protein MELLADRAFT_115738 [Melampsora larici-populina 98AG31]|uniref:Uncharacterized protein n=1 Tax=Melampsora larici-populina (strain 98AG31 / pathotype 3-4-7) TaxID=747676 RepID=F4RDI7_MELLP|nr:uncharacterized protein MELLADRAFT_115738 [Melampsora larici-populina 98AG31]EGG09602.1 hypothetical protein MELLADRAFT_115738 [Melampsora larici-populina 98AG31]